MLLHCEAKALCKEGNLIFRGGGWGNLKTICNNVTCASGELRADVIMSKQLSGESNCIIKKIYNIQRTAKSTLADVIIAKPEHLKFKNIPQHSL